MKRILRWSVRAESDLREITAYIGRDKPLAAVAWYEAIRELAHSLADMPGRGRVYEPEGRDDIREKVTGNYSLVYRIGTDEVEVLAVIEGHRRRPRVT